MGVDVSVGTRVICYHCGQACEETLWLRDKSFCCHGCKTVYEILSENDLCEYYDLDKSPGIRLKTQDESIYDCLDELEVRKRFVAFDSGTFTRVRFNIPSIHCVSCIWLLENLRKIEPAVLRAEVEFAHKRVTIDFSPERITLSAIGKLLASLGYAPQISLQQNTGQSTGINHALVLKLTVAGFCFGNVMLFSFPEYFGLDAGDLKLRSIFSWLNMALSLPVFFYSASDYLHSALAGFRQKRINIDVPIAVGLLALLTRSIWDIITGAGPGYLDSLTGLVFFLLIGRWFQGKTYESLAFDRDFKSYFPLAVQRLTDKGWGSVVIYDLEKGDRIRIRNMEIIPADSFLLDSTALIDYSFVTGESKPAKVHNKELIYAGGRLLGAPVTLLVDKKTSQSHLTGLWNSQAFQKSGTSHHRTLDKVAAVFTWAVVIIALATAFYWQLNDPSQVWLNVTAVLIVACPCALALTAPFTYGNMMRAFGRRNLYLKNAEVVEKMAAVDAVVFDKTGTVTHGSEPEVKFVGYLNDEELPYIKSLTEYSTHPLSAIVSGAIPSLSSQPVLGFNEYPGKGIEGRIGEHELRIGSAPYVGAADIKDPASRVFVSIDNEVRGYFSIKTSLRRGITGMIRRLGTKCSGLLSGDSPAGREQIRNVFPDNADLLFEQSPHAKLRYIRALQQEGKHVMMVGDGLNDAGALTQSDIGIAVTDDTGVFTPASDGIIKGSMIGSLDAFLDLAKSAATILKTGFVISFLYNAVALSFAVTGLLTPLMAAILMPLSSISVVVFSTVAVNWVANRKLNVQPESHEG
ncbi:MAG TPA: heavy metal translocating P-type ATPase metal-binding domain-containing protein [Cyclobacteriaceae bacterium]